MRIREQPRRSHEPNLATIRLGHRDVGSPTTAAGYAKVETEASIMIRALGPDKAEQDRRHDGSLTLHLKHG